MPRVKRCSTAPLCSIIIACLVFATALKVAAATSISVTILEEKPHNPRIFSQGMMVHGRDIVASSGLYGQSYIVRYDKQSGEQRALRRLPAHYFAEGLTIVDDTLYLLTWQAQTLLTFDANSLAPKGTRSYSGQGWGLTDDGRHFIMSDGSYTLYFRTFDRFAIHRKIDVHNKWRKYRKLNELEWAKGHIWANIWQSPLILQISPGNGAVVGVADLSDLVRKNSRIPSDTVLNGIAYDAERDAFWLTGKLWPRRYLVRFSDPTSIEASSE